MNKISVLVTTSLQETWLVDENTSIFFLTEACKSYSERDKWENINSNTLEYHWNDRSKLKYDHDYLKNLYEEILTDITIVFNDKFKINERREYYRIVLGPWLINYLPILFDRWETLRCAFELDNNYVTANLIGLNDNSAAKDFNSFIELMQTDLWNYNLYKRIIAFQYSEQCELVGVKYIPEQRQIGKSENLKLKILAAADNVLKFISKSPNIFFYKSYIPPLKLVELNLALGQVPRFYFNEFNFDIVDDLSLDFRKNFKMGLLAKSDFEVFLFNCIFIDMPLSYMESFIEIRSYTSTLPFYPDKIVTSIAYWTEDIFKIWMAGKVNDNTSLLIVCHGGSFPFLFNTFDHEEDISNTYITWFKPFHPKHVQLPPNKLVQNRRPRISGKNCSVIGFESPKYGYRATSSPITNRTLDCFDQTSTFCSALSYEIKEQLRIRPYPKMGWQTSKRYADKFGTDKIEIGNSYERFIKESKLIVCTYPQTTFSESMASGIPTILVFIPEINETIPQGEELLNILKEAKIAFTDPLEAAKHVNAIWGDVFRWWDSIEVVAAKKQFYETALRIDLDWKKSWVDYLKSDYAD
jgi:putative transferase (TIGR04331 family)